MNEWMNQWMDRGRIKTLAFPWGKAKVKTKLQFLGKSKCRRTAKSHCRFKSYSNFAEINEFFVLDEVWYQRGLPRQVKIYIKLFDNSCVSSPLPHFPCSCANFKCVPGSATPVGSQKIDLAQQLYMIATKIATGLYLNIGRPKIAGL